MHSERLRQAVLESGKGFPTPALNHPTNRCCFFQFKTLEGEEWSGLIRLTYGRLGEGFTFCPVDENHKKVRSPITFPPQVEK